MVLGFLLLTQGCLPGDLLPMVDISLDRVGGRDLWDRIVRLCKQACCDFFPFSLFSPDGKKFFSGSRATNETYVVCVVAGDENFPCQVFSFHYINKIKELFDLENIQKSSGSTLILYPLKNYCSAVQRNCSNCECRSYPLHQKTSMLQLIWSSEILQSKVGEDGCLEMVPSELSGETRNPMDLEGP